MSDRMSRVVLSAVLVATILQVCVVCFHLTLLPRRERQELSMLLALSEANDLCSLLDVAWRPFADFSCSNHDVMTSDGYLLRLKRLGHAQRPAGNRTILLVPGLGDSSSTFVLSGRRRSLAGTLLDHGLDVWLLDARGRAPLIHVNHSSDSESFWDFSLDEKVEIDLPTAIKFILQHTGSATLGGLIGHSQGALVILAYLSMPEASSVDNAFLLAPPLSGWSPAYAFVREGALFPFAHQVIPNKDVASTMLLVRSFVSRACSSMPRFCRAIFCLLSGCGRQSVLDESKLGRILTFYPSASSLKNVEHLFHCERQAGLVRNFLKKDHFVLEDFSRINSTNLHLFFGSSDRLVDRRRYGEGLRLFQRQVVRKYRVFEYGHADFVWGENARELIYEDIAKDLWSSF